MPNRWITFTRLLGVFLICLIAYNWINQDLGLTISSSIALFLFGGCLIGVYQGYKPNNIMLVGWLLIAASCLIFAIYEELSWTLVFPTLLFIAGYRIAGLPFDLRGGSGDGYIGSDSVDGGGD